VVSAKQVICGVLPFSVAPWFSVSVCGQAQALPVSLRLLSSIAKRQRLPALSCRLGGAAEAPAHDPAGKDVDDEGDIDEARPLLRPGKNWRTLPAQKKKETQGYGGT